MKPKITHQKAQAWVEKYITAWRSPGVAMLAVLFTNDISYLPSPWAEPIEGLEKLSAFWQKSRTGPDEDFQIGHEIIATDQNTAVVRVEVAYKNDTPSRWRDLWIIRYQHDGLCYHFEEWPFHPNMDDGQA